MSTSGTVLARWKPLYSVTLPDGRTLKPGGTAEISAGEAKASDHWEPVKGATVKKDEE